MMISSCSYCYNIISKQYRKSSCTVLSSVRHFASSNNDSSLSSSFFTYTSVRARKRRLRLHQRRKRQSPSGDISTEEDSFDGSSQYKDTRTVRDILFPNPFKDDPNVYPPRRTWPEWQEQFRFGWEEYKKTWEGPFLGRSTEENNEEDNNNKTPSLNEKLRSKGEEVLQNAKRNAKFLEQETEQIQAKVREVTGIHDKDDLRRVAAETMKLATDCLKEFMDGYRKGRDDEVEKMLTQYFKELEKEANKPKRRKRKRRVVRA